VAKSEALGSAAIHLLGTAATALTGKNLSTSMQKMYFFRLC